MGAPNFTSSPTAPHRDFPAHISPIRKDGETMEENLSTQSTEGDNPSSHSYSSFGSTQLDPQHHAGMHKVYYSPKFEAGLCDHQRPQDDDPQQSQDRSHSPLILHKPGFLLTGQPPLHTHLGGFDPRPLCYTMGTQTDPNFIHNTRSVQTEQTGVLPHTNLPRQGNTDNRISHIPQVARSPIFSHPARDEDARPSSPLHLPLLQITLHTQTHHRDIFVFQTEDEDSMTTAKSVDALVDQVKALMLDASRFTVRAEHLYTLEGAHLLTPWATGVQPHPPFVMTNPKLLSKIREVRVEAAHKIQALAQVEFERQSNKLQKEGETLIMTLESMMNGKNVRILDERLTHTASYIGKNKAALQTKMEEGRLFLSKRQPTLKDWDDYFHYSIAYRRNHDARNQAFEVTPSDRFQAEADTAREIETLNREDSDSSDQTPDPRRPKRKRGDAPAPHKQRGTYKIPKKGINNKQGRRDRRDERDHTPQRNQNRNDDNRDFGRSRPSRDHKGVYYNSNPNRNNNRDGRDPSMDRRGRDGQDHQDRKLLELQRELDFLKRN